MKIKDLELILKLLKNLGFELSSFDLNSWDFDKLSSPIHIKITKVQKREKLMFELLGIKKEE